MEVQSRHNRAWMARWAVCVTIQCLFQNRWNILVPESSSGSKVCWCDLGSSSLSALHEKDPASLQSLLIFLMNFAFILLLLLEEIRNLDRLLGYIAADVPRACNSLNGMHRCGCSGRSTASGNDIDFGRLRSRSRHGL